MKIKGDRIIRIIYIVIVFEFQFIRFKKVSVFYNIRKEKKQADNCLVIINIKL